MPETCFPNSRSSDGDQGTELEAEAVVDHGEAAGREVEPLAIDAGDELAFAGAW